MQKVEEDDMSTNELAYFNECVNDLIDGELILVNKNIASLLKCVVASPVLSKVLAGTVKNTSYVTEFSRARVTWTRADGVVMCQLKLPQDTTRLFTFVVCLFTEIDSGRRNVLDFLHEYYADVDNDASYRRFVNEVIKPFKRAGESLLRNVDPASFGKDEMAQAEKFFTAEKVYVQSGVLTSLVQISAALKETLLASKLSDGNRTEIYSVTDYLVNGLYLKNPKILKVCWMAYRNFMIRFPVAKPYLYKMSQLMNKIAL